MALHRISNLEFLSLGFPTNMKTSNTHIVSNYKMEEYVTDISMFLYQF